MTTIKWALKEKFNEQDVKFLAMRERFDRAFVEAGTRLADLKSEKEALLQKEFQTGADLTTEKAKNRENIAEAEKAVETAGQERDQANEYARTAAQEGRITVEDMYLDWRDSYRKEVRESELQPILDRMKAASDEYFNALLDFYELNDKYRHEFGFIQDLTSGTNLYPEQIAAYRELPLITDSANISIDNKRALPYGIERKKTSK